MRFFRPFKPFPCFQALLLGLLLTVGGNHQGWGQESGSASEKSGKSPVVIAEWNFEDQVKRVVINPSNFIYTADYGTPDNINNATLTALGPVFTSFVRGTGGLGTYAPNFDRWNGGASSKYWIVDFSTVGFENISISSAQRSSETGPKDFALEVSINGGGSWSNLLNFNVGDGPFDNPDFLTGSIDVALPGDVNNQPSVLVRWLMTTNTAVNNDIVSAQGTNRIDDIVIMGEEASSTDYELTVVANPEQGGAAGESGFYHENAQVLVIATANPGWVFVNWTVNDAVVSDNPSYSFDMPGHDLILTANFQEEPTPKFTITATSEGNGSITPAGVVEVEEGDNQVFTFNALPGFQVSEVIVDGVSQELPMESYTFTNVTSNHTIHVVFTESPTYKLTLIADPEFGGAVSGEVSGEGEYAKGAPINVTAYPEDDWDFVSPMEGLQFTMPGEGVTLVAHFEPESSTEPTPYTLTIVIDPPEGGMVTVNGEEYSEPIIYSFDDEDDEIIVLLKAIPKEDYVFGRWEAPVETIYDLLEYEYKMPHGNIIITAIFTFTGTVTQPETYDLTLISSPEGAGILSGAGSYKEDEEVEVRAEASDGYVFLNWTLDGVEESADAVFTFTMPEKNVELTAHFSEAVVPGPGPGPEPEPEPLEVTFRVNMKRANGFAPGLDKVYFTGSMFDYAVPGDVPEQELQPTGDPMVFSRTIDLLPGRYYYKFYLNEGFVGAEWPSSPIRIADVTKDNVVFNDVFGEHHLTVSAGLPDQPGTVVYPNPAMHTMHIAAENGQAIFAVRLINLQGQEVYLSRDLASERHQIDVRGLKSGLYVLQVLDPAGWSVHRVQVIGE